MKKIKFLLLLVIAVIFFAGAESFAYPRHRIHRYYRVRPYYHKVFVRQVQHPIVVKKYYVVRKPKIYHRHHKRIIRRVVYY
jgi:hypothetical protein